MSEITKLYENAGVEYEERYNNCTLNKEGECELKCSCDICKYSEEKYIYPPFTAEKQLKIIEWLGNSKTFFDANETIFSLITNHKDKNGVVKGYEGKGNSIDSCLASLINDLWQDLTEEEKEQVKGILE